MQLFINLIDVLQYQFLVFQLYEQIINFRKII